MARSREAVDTIKGYYYHISLVHNSFISCYNYIKQKH